MAFIGDTTPIRRQLKLTNYAESLEGETCYHVSRISFVVTILDDVEGSGGNSFVNLSKEDQQLLNWQPSPEDLQDDVKVRDTLTQQSGRLCPHKNISTSLYDKVKSDDDTLQSKTGDRPLSAYEHVSFRSAMLTKHSAGDGQQPELLALHDGLGGEQSFLRWRSHDYIKVTLCKPRDFFTVFWLIQWDIVDLKKLRAYGAVATNHQGKRRRSPLFHLSPVPGPASEKFHGVRFRKDRKSAPWIAEVRRGGADRRKIWLGNYNSKVAAARAADAGSFYYDRSDMLNFRDSPQHLPPIPVSVRNDECKKKFVKAAAKRLAKMTERLPSTWNPQNRTSCCLSMDKTLERGNVRSGSIFRATKSTSPNSDGIPRLVMSDSDLDTDLDFHPPASSGGDIGQETVGISLKRNLRPSTSSFKSHSHGGAGVCFVTLEQLDMPQQAFSPAGDCSTDEVADTWNGNIVLNIPDCIAGDLIEFDSSQGAEFLQNERDGDWEGANDDIFDHWSMDQNFSESTY